MCIVQIITIIQISWVSMIVMLSLKSSSKLNDEMAILKRTKVLPHYILVRLNPEGHMNMVHSQVR